MSELSAEVTLSGRLLRRLECSFYNKHQTNFLVLTALMFAVMVMIVADRQGVKDCGNVWLKRGISNIE